MIPVALAMTTAILTSCGGNKPEGGSEVKPDEPTTGEVTEEDKEPARSELLPKYLKEAQDYYEQKATSSPYDDEQTNLEMYKSYRFVSVLEEKAKTVIDDPKNVKEADFKAALAAYKAEVDEQEKLLGQCEFMLNGVKFNILSSGNNLKQHELAVVPSKVVCEATYGDDFAKVLAEIKETYKEWQCVDAMLLTTDQVQHFDKDELEIDKSYFVQLNSKTILSVDLERNFDSVAMGEKHGIRPVLILSDNNEIRLKKLDNFKSEKYHHIEDEITSLALFEKFKFVDKSTTIPYEEAIESAITVYEAEFATNKFDIDFTYGWFAFEIDGAKFQAIGYNETEEGDINYNEILALPLNCEKFDSISYITHNKDYEDFENSAYKFYDEIYYDFDDSGLKGWRAPKKSDIEVINISKLQYEDDWWLKKEKTSDGNTYYYSVSRYGYLNVDKNSSGSGSARPVLIFEKESKF